MLTINPLDIGYRAFYSYTQHSVAPRPIAFASTIDKNGRVNLSPFSFFNVMGIDPSIVVFAPNNRRDGSKKNTPENLLEVPEVVINLVDYPMVQQMSLASCEYEKGINEFIKAGFTEEKSVMIRPPRVKESPVQLECQVLEIKEIGSMNLVICQVLLGHFDEKLLDKQGKINQLKTDFVARLGGDWYAHITPETLFEVPKPSTQKGIGFDNLPQHIRDSKILTGNHLGMLANAESLPSEAEIREFGQARWIQEIFEEARYGCVYLDDLLHTKAKDLLQNHRIKEAWLILLQK